MGDYLSIPTDLLAPLARFDEAMREVSDVEQAYEFSVSVYDRESRQVIGILGVDREDEEAEAFGLFKYYILPSEESWVAETDTAAEDLKSRIAELEAENKTLRSKVDGDKTRLRHIEINCSAVIDNLARLRALQGSPAFKVDGYNYGLILKSLSECVAEAKGPEE